MAKPTISPDIQTSVQQIVETYNQKHKTKYQVRFRGKFCYLSRIDDHSEEVQFMNMAAKMLGLPKSMINQAPQAETRIGRLEWTGDMSHWNFAVYKYSREEYDPEEWMFPGSEILDGSIEGALKAGKTIYP
ncbi:MAG: hypothetical protein LH618_00325 [Saprospiraceae bacterium]|nr:hypothetical protein [Saprospiraceae bacterium]